MKLRMFLLGVLTTLCVAFAAAGIAGMSKEIEVLNFELEQCKASKSKAAPKKVWRLEA